MKKFSCITLICLICTFSFLAPICNSASYSYAATIPEGWTQASSNADLVSAFKAYCKSRNLAIEGSIADAVTSFTTSTFNNICNTLGIDVTALQAEIASRTDSNVGLQWFFTDSGVSAYNRIFAEFLQNNNLSVGDEVNNLNIYSGRYFTDDQGNTCLVYEINSNTSNILKYGTPYLYNYNYFVDNTSSFTVNHSFLNNNYTLDFNYLNNGTIKGTTCHYYNNNTSYSTIYLYYFRVSDSSTDNAEPSVIFDLYNNKLYMGAYSYRVNSTVTDRVIKVFELSYTIGDNFNNTNIYITTNNNTINNNTYEGDTIINNNGDQGSGGGSSDNNPITPPSDGNSGTGEGSGGTGSDGTITFPDFNFDFPSINWSLGDLSQKFPFSIPFDLVAFFTVLNAEPEAPMIDANIPLGSFYTWHFVADFSQFDNYAVIIRNVEFLAFCIGLIYITIRLVKG